MPSQYPHRNPIEIKLQDKLDGYVPVFNRETGLWFTVPTSSFKEGAISSSQQITIGDTAGDTFGDKDYTFQRNLTVNQNLFVLGRLTAQEYYSEIVSASIIYEQGSTKFGDTPDDTHQFTGSMLIRGDSRTFGNTFIAGDMEVLGNISFGTAGGSVFNVLGDFAVQGATTLQGPFTVYNSSELYGSLFVQGSTTIGQTIDDFHQIYGTVALEGNMTVTGDITANFLNGTSAFAQTASLANNSSFSVTASFSNTIGIISAGIYQTGSDIPIVKR